MEWDELKERIAECLRGLEIDESFSAEGIADEIGETLSDVYNALDEMLTQRLIFQHPGIGKRDPTYTLTGKGRTFGTAVTRPKDVLPEVEVKEELAEPTPDNCACQYCGTILSSLARRRNHEPVCGKNPDRNSQKKEMSAKAQKAKDTKDRKQKEEALVECPDCHKMVKRISMHKAMGGCKPMVDAKKVVSNAVDLQIQEDVPPVSEYAETATATIEHEVTVEEHPFAPNPDLCTGCANYVDGKCDEGCKTDGDCNHSHRPSELKPWEVPSVEEILGQQHAAEPDLPDETPDEPPLEIPLHGSPGLGRLMLALGAVDTLRQCVDTMDLSLLVQVDEGYDVVLSVKRGDI